MEEHPRMLSEETWQVQKECLSPQSRVVYQKHVDEYCKWCLEKGKVVISA